MTLVDQLDSRRLRTIDVDGVATRVWEDGEGEPLVLVHGGDFGSNYSLDSWSLVLPLLARHFHVIAFDKLGQGRTGNPRRDGDYTVPALRSHALGVLRVLDIGPAHLVGHSMGAFLVARLTLDDPSLARSLVLVDSNTLAPDDPRHPWRRFYQDLAERMPPGPSTESVRLEPDAQSVSTTHVTDDFVARLLETALLPEHQEAKRRRDALLESTWLPSLQPERERTIAELGARGSPVPTLVVWAADDPSAPLPLGLRLFEIVAERTPRSELHVFAHAGHYVYREHPEAFARLVTGFCHERRSQEEIR